MQANHVLDILDALAAADVPVWLDGGWGVDALLGEQTRNHEDMDIVVMFDHLDAAFSALASLGFVVAEDDLPTRGVLRSDDGHQVDIHPVTFDEEGTGWQKGAAPDGTDCPYPADGFDHGEILGRTVPTLTAALQMEHHSGYEPRERDRVDVAALSAAFGLPTPDRY